MREWKALVSINLSLALLLGAVCPVAFAEEEPAEVLPVVESVPVEDAGDLPPSEEEAGDGVSADTIVSDSIGDNNGGEVALAEVDALVQETTGYVFVCSYQIAQSNLGNGRDYARVIFQDGTEQVVGARQGDTIGEDAIEQDTYCVNKWYAYSLDESGIYTLTAAADSQLIDSNQGIIDQAHASLSDSTQRVYGNNSSVYLMVDAEETCGDAVCARNERISGVSFAYTGIQNTAINVSGNVYALFDASGYVVCAVVVGELIENTGTPMYLMSKDEYVTTNQHASYYVCEAIIDDGVTTVREKVTNAGSPGAAPHKLYSYIADEAGYIESIAPVSLTELSDIRSACLEVGYAALSTGGSAWKMTVEGSSLNLRDALGNTASITLDTACNFFVYNSEGNASYMEFTAAALAVEELGKSGHFTGGLAVLSDKNTGYATSVMIYDTVFETEEDPTVNSWGIGRVNALDVVATLYTDGRLVISGSGDMKNYTVDSMPWYANRGDITKVVVEEGVTAIGDYAFSNCRNLTEVELNSSVLTSIGDYAFQNAAALQTVSGSGAAAVTVIGSYAFDNCSVLTDIDVFSGLERIGAYAFSDCSALTEVTLPDSVTAMGHGAFCDCDGLTTVTLSAGMTEISNSAFYQCNYLTTVTVPDSVTTIGSQAFQYCNRLKNLELSTGLETIGSSAFCYCNGLQTVTIGDAVATIGYDAFWSCSGLQTVTIGSGIQTIGYSAFKSCSALQTVTIDAYRMLVDAAGAFDSSITVLWKQADENTALKTWDIGMPTASSAQATLYGDGRLVVSGKGAITSGGWIKGNVNAVIVEDGITSIGSSVFSNMSNLKTVTIGDTVTSIGSSAFYNCSALKSVAIGKAIRTIDYNAFSSCSALETVTIDNYEMLVSLGNNAFPSTTAVTYKSTAGEAVPLQSWEIGTQDETDATATLYTDGRLVISGQGGIKTGGWNKSAIKAIEIQDGITSISDSAFYEYTALESVQFGEGISSIPYQAFDGCYALKSVGFPSNLTMIGDYAFRNCSALREVNLPDRVSTIGRAAFYNCQNLETLHLPENLITIGYFAFYNCSSLRELVIPDRVTTIEYGAFLFASSLEKLTIGKGVRTIGNSAFANCYGLKELHWNVPSYETFASDSAVFAAAGRDSGGFDLYLGAGVKTIPAYMFYSSSSAAGNEVNLLHVYNGSDCLQSVGNFAFYRCLNLSSIALGQALTWIGDGTFNTCPSLTAIALPESLGSIGRKAFFRSGLTRLETWNGLTSIGAQAFDECASGFTLVGFAGSYAQTYADENSIPFTPYAAENTAALTVHGNSSFMDYVRSLKTLVGRRISLAGFSDSVQIEMDRYTSNKNLTGWNTQPDGSGTGYAKDAQVTLDADTDLYAQWEEIPVAIIDKGICGANVTWTLDNRGKLTISGTGAMYNQGCQSTVWWRYRSRIYSVVVEEGVTAVGGESFCGCYNLKTATLADSVTSIGSWAFENCEALETVYCGSDLQTVRGSSFAGCLGLKDIWFYGAVSSIANNAFSGCGTAFTMHGLAGSYVETYAQQYGYAFSVNEDAEVDTVELTLRGGTRLQDFAISVKRLIGRVVSLLSYSKQMQNEMNRYTSDANLVGWNTQPDGSGTAFAKNAQVTLDGDMDLYAQWEGLQMTIDGNRYPIDTPCSGDGWHYDTETLFLNGYSGGSIIIPGASDISVSGQNTINGKLRIVRFDTYATGNTATLKATYKPLVLTVQENSTLTIRNPSETAPAIEALSARCQVYGTLEISSESNIGLWTEQKAQLFAWDGLIKITAAERALRCGRGYSFGGTAGVYSDVGTDSPGYYGGPYLRMECVMQTLTFHANGGTWKDQTVDEKQVTNPDGTEFDLAELRELISRPGYVLSGWMAENDQLDFGVNGIVTFSGDLTLYAQWTAADSFSIGGTSYRADQAASGTGWRFAPAQSGDFAVLTLDSAYAGGEIFAAVPLRIVTAGTVSVTAGIGKPGVEALQDLDIRVNSGSLTVTAGDGCDAIVAQGDVNVTAGGALATRGGAGGLAIRSIGSVLLTGSNQITLTGGQNACAVWADKDVDIRNTGDTYLIGSGWNAVSSGNLLLLDDALKVYAGQNTGDAVRVESLADAWGPYLHTKKKSVSVVLMANGGELNGETMSVMELPESAENEIRLCVLTPERTGYEFQGWNSRADGSGTAFAPNEVYRLPAAQDELTLFAQWEVKEFDFDDAGVTVQCDVPAGAETVLLAMYDTDGRLLGTAAGGAVDASHWRFDSRLANTAASMKVLAMDPENKPLMVPVVYQRRTEN